LITFSRAEAELIRYNAQDPESFGENLSWAISQRDKFLDFLHREEIRRKILGTSFIRGSKIQWEEIHQAILHGEIQVSD
jgi:hypothetical protein